MTSISQASVLRLFKMTLLGIVLCLAIAEAMPTAQTLTCLDDEMVMMARCAKKRCVLGCRLCNWYYGRFNYNLWRCANECATTGADMVDQGPQRCSVGMVRPGDDYRPDTAPPYVEDDSDE